jgi:hypothetical protein
MDTTARGSCTLDEKLDYARAMLASAIEARDRATQQHERAHEMGRGIPGFGGSGNQRAARQVRGALDSAFRAGSAADERVEHWKYKVRRYSLRVAERDRQVVTREDVLGATAVRDTYGWHRVAKVNAKSVTVKTGYSWTDRIEFRRILEVRS